MELNWKTVRVRGEDYKALKAYTQGHGRHIGFILSEAIRQYIERETAKAKQVA